MSCSHIGCTTRVSPVVAMLLAFTPKCPLCAALLFAPLGLLAPGFYKVFFVVACLMAAVAIISLARHATNGRRRGAYLLAIAGLGFTCGSRLFGGNIVALSFGPVLTFFSLIWLSVPLVYRVGKSQSIQSACPHTEASNGK